MDAQKKSPKQKSYVLFNEVGNKLTRVKAFCIFCNSYKLFLLKIDVPKLYVWKQTLIQLFGPIVGVAGIIFRKCFKTIPF